MHQAFAARSVALRAAIERIARGYIELAYGIRDDIDALHDQGVRRIKRAQKAARLPSYRGTRAAFRRA